MLVSKKEYNKLKKQKDEIIAALESEIEDQEKKLNKSSKKLNNLADKITYLKTGIDSISELYEYESNDVVIANITNFLIEQGAKEASQVISKCRVYDVSIVRFSDKPEYGLSINLHCPGDSYKILNDNDDPLRNTIIEAFIAYYSYTHMKEIFIKSKSKNHFRWRNINRGKPALTIEFSMRRIDPKESDIEKFFEKVEELKKQLKAE